MSALLALVLFAHAAPPCDPSSEVGWSEGMTGFCVKEATFLELGTLRVEARALQLEVDAFELWQASRTADMLATVDAMKVAHAQDLATLRTFYTVELEEERRRSRRGFFEKNGVMVGLVLGVAASIGLAAALDSAL